MVVTFHDIKLSIFV